MTNKFIYSEVYDDLAFPGGPRNIHLPLVKPKRVEKNKKTKYSSGKHDIPPPWEFQAAVSYVEKKDSTITITPPSYHLSIDNRPYSADSQNSYPIGSGDSGITPPS